MSRIALMMLFGRPHIFAAMVFGMSFAVLLITLQTSIFLGVLERTTGPLQSVGNVDLWVTSRHTISIIITRAISEQYLYRTQSIAGVAWAKPFFSRRALVELPDGSFDGVDVIGIDRSTLIGQPPEMLEGNLDDLRAPDAVLLESSRRARLPGVGVGDMLRLNDQRARVVGICRAKPGILSRPIIYTTYDNAVRFAPIGRNAMTWMLIKLKPRADAQRVSREIERRLGLAAFTPDQLRWTTMKYVIFQTGLGLNFLVTVLLGFLVGMVVSTATFNQFTSASLPHFAVLKAVGAPAFTLIRMVVAQGLTVGLISYGIGFGLAAVTSLPARTPDTQFVSLFPWQLIIVALVPMLLCVVLGSLMSVWRVIRLDPVVVFQFRDFDARQSIRPRKSTRD